MSEYSREVITMKEFGEEDAGKLVSWYNFNISEGIDEERVFASVAVAMVGGDGAKFTYLRHEEDGEVIELSHAGSVTGFENSAELTVIANRTTGEVENLDALKQPESIYGRGRRGRDNGFADSFIGYDESPRTEAGEWNIGGEEIIKALRKATKSNDIDFAYPDLYYNLNQMLPDYMRLADSRMRSQTESSLANARAISQKLQSIIKLDGQMLHNLTVFGDVPASEIPDVFVQSRTEVAENERQIKILQESLPFGFWYRGVGWRPGGRSWPYMDPEAKEEIEAFGRELAELRAKNSVPAVRELKRELDELKGRVEASENIASKLGYLAARELDSALDKTRK